MYPPLLSVIIVNYRVYEHVATCLRSLTAHNIDAKMELIVVDNASSSEALRALQMKFTHVHWIVNESNLGFSKANNQALHIAKGKYILFLNPDTEISAQVVWRMIDFFEKHATAGVIGVQMCNAQGDFLPESKRSFPTARVAFFKLFGFAALFPRSRFFNAYALGHLNKEAVHRVSILAGACMMVPQKVLNEVGYFDERFFMYAEDIDLCYRIERAGYTNYYLGTEKIVHYKGASTDRSSKPFRAYFYGSMRLFVKKYSSAVYGRTVARILVFGIGLARGLAALRHFLLRSSNNS